MSGGCAHARARRRRVDCAAAWGAMLLLVPAALWAGCSAQTRYKVMSFFFDGVPDPNAPVNPEVALASGDIAAMGSVHPPFAQDQCSACHGDPSSTRLDRDSGGICLSCHSGIDAQYPFMHGPVVAQSCLWCHNPHFSKTTFLLRLAPPNLCMQCHSEGQLTLRRPSGALLRPEHMDLTRNCLECHHGHGSAKPGLLRAQVPDNAAESSEDDASP